MRKSTVLVIIECAAPRQCIAGGDDRPGLRTAENEEESTMKSFSIAIVMAALFVSGCSMICPKGECADKCKTSECQAKCDCKCGCKKDCAEKCEKKCEAKPECAEKCEAAPVAAPAAK